jgi:exodeoxyribonuclease V beta subunit
MCERICRLEKDYEQALLRDFIQFAQKELPRRKEERKVQWFDDLLSRTLSALKGPGDGDLAAALRQKYRAALIDEFQDTDPVQYRIFEAIYSGEDQWLYLIGDPKQAIYGFRGADVFTYLEACRKVKQRFTLGQNWRSESGLVQAVNAFFQDHGNPFVFGEISFAPVEARGKADQERLTINGERKAPAEIWFWESEGTLSKEKTCQVLPGVVAGEIARLLRENTRIGERKLSPQDIAVLAPENQQARLIQQALNELSVPSVLYTTSSVFASGEAEELRRVLFSMAEPGNERLLRAALAGEMLGAEAAHIESLSKDESGWARWLLKFQDYLGLWNEHGFLQMFRRFLQQEQVRARLLRLREGERKLTNILHLGELLHQASIESRLGVSGLLKWFNAQISAGKESVEEEQLRLESDETAVRIITIHRSKGLEFPVVFCPFLNRVAGLKKRGGIFFHDEDGQLVCDFGSEKAELHEQGAFAEALAENVRLFYVAVTRAKHRLYLVCGKFKEGHATAPGWLFHRPQDLPNQEWRQVHARYFNELSSENLKQALETMAKASGESDGGPVLSITSLPDSGETQPFVRGENEPVLDGRQFTGRIPSDWRIASFSFLSSGRHDEAPDRDRELRLEKELQPASGMFAFPRGSKAGACLHELLEEIDFTAADGDLHRPVVERALRSHGFDPAFSESLMGMVQQVCLLPLRNQADQFMLSTLKSGEWLKELEFYFPLRNFFPRELKECLEEAGFPGQLDHFPSGARLWLDPMNGFLKGYIDLVFRSGGRFYFLDWKSNWLGNRIEDYHRKALGEVMRNRCYELQSLLYSVALHQHLELRLPDYGYEQHFGGSFYIFLRGLDAARPEFGVHASRPSLELIRRMSGLFSSCSR